MNLNPQDESIINFSTVSVSEGLSYTFDFAVTSVNGGADGSSANNDLSVTTKIPSGIVLPFSQPFNSTPSNWNIENPSGTYPWQNVSVSNSNNAMYLDFYDNANLDSYSRLVSPVIDLTNETTATLTFDHAYSIFSSANPDRLRVIIYTTCAYDAAAVEVFNKSGSTLATADPTSSPFFPTSTQWKTNFISLEPFLGSKIQIAFEGVNENGNNLFIDNVTVLNSSITAFELIDLASPSPVSCNTDIIPVIAVRNVGNTVITSMESHVILNTGSDAVQTLSNISIDPGSTQNILLNDLSLVNGNNTIDITIKQPNGIPNTATADHLTFKRNINTSEDIIPLRENFDVGFVGNWQGINPQGGENWFVSETNKGQSMLYDAFSYPTPDDQAWLVSPTLDFSSAQTASLFFESSYAINTVQVDKLEVYASEDCGVTFPDLVFSKSGTELANATSTTSWKPSSDTDWTRQYANLDAYAGKKNIRFAFIATNDNGNNIYLDNIEFYVSDNPNPVKAKNPYSVYGGLGAPVKITFNLDQTQNANVQVYNMQGSLLSNQDLTNVLNQTFTIDVPNVAAGVYIVRVQTGKSLSSAKVFLGF